MSVPTLKTMTPCASVLENQDILSNIFSYLVYRHPLEPPWQTEEHIRQQRGPFKSIKIILQVSKRFNEQAWKSLPTALFVRGHQNIVKCLHKVPDLKLLTVSLRVSKFDEDANLFQSNLLSGRTKKGHLRDTFRNLHDLVLRPTYRGLSASELNAILERQYQEIFGCSSTSGCHKVKLCGPDESFDNFIGYSLDETAIRFEKTIIPQTSYTLDNLGLLPDGLKLTLTNIVPPTRLGEFGILNLECYPIHNSQFTSSNVLASIATSSIKSLTITRSQIPCDDSREGNGFTNKLLKCLPPSIEVLDISSSPYFQLPCKFPSVLRHVKISGLFYSKPHLKGCFSEGLESLSLCLEEDIGDGDAPEYDFKSFDVTGLPNSLVSLEFRDFGKMHDNPVSIVGSFPASLRSLRLEGNSYDFDTTVLYPRNATERKIKAEMLYGNDAKLALLSYYSKRDDYSRYFWCGGFGSETETEYLISN